jgi:hypothetical protein
MRAMHKHWFVRVLLVSVVLRASSWDANSNLRPKLDLKVSQQWF